MFVLNPDPYSLPSYRIGPFQTRDVSLNHRLPESVLIDDYLKTRFDKRGFLYTDNGRRAINIALSYYDLKRDDVVTILTSSGNFYVSGCVTKEIEKFCKWSRELLPETKVILVNHEFGYPYPELHKLKDLRLPIIEDCAGSFFSEDIFNNIGNIGDFVIYSFPKMFPLQIGGLLVSNIHDSLESMSIYRINEELLKHIRNVLSVYIKDKEAIIQQRMFNYRFLRSQFELLGVKERFDLIEGVVPAVFMFRTGNLKLNLPELKIHFYSHGIQCSVFYGEDAFFIPVHQSLTEEDLNYFIEVFKSFISRK
jgi:hypothetical protein